jgi:hypothetical protein
MGLLTASILTGATISATGGTAQTFGSNGKEVTNGVQVIDTSVTDFRTRPTLTAKTADPVQLPDGSLTKDKRIVTYAEPFVDTRGVIQYDYLRIERRIHPESPASKGVEFNKKGAQLLNDTDFTSYWATGNLGA